MTAVDQSELTARIYRTFGALNHTLSSRAVIIEDPDAEVLLEQRLAVIMQTNQLPNKVDIDEWAREQRRTAAATISQLTVEDVEMETEGAQRLSKLDGLDKEYGGSVQRGHCANPSRGVPRRFQDTKKYEHYSLDDVEDFSDAQNRAIATQFLQTRPTEDLDEGPIRMILPVDITRPRTRPSLPIMPVINEEPMFSDTVASASVRRMKPINARRTLRPRPATVASFDEGENELELMSKKPRPCVFLDHLRDSD